MDTAVTRSLFDNLGGSEIFKRSNFPILFKTWGNRINLNEFDEYRDEKFYL